MDASIHGYVELHLRETCKANLEIYPNDVPADYLNG